MLLTTHVQHLIEETEGRADALNYVEEIARDLGITVDLVIAELDRQYEVGDSDIEVPGEEV